MEPFSLPQSPHYDGATFNGTAVTAGTSWQTWIKPSGKAYANILVIGGGGRGGNGAVGANSSAAGGGGGGSGGMTIVEIPLDLLPSRLYISVGAASLVAGIASYVSVAPNTTANHIIAMANGGGAGGNASGATAGGAGAAGSIATTALMPLGFGFAKSVLAGQAGTAGSANGNATNITFPVTGLRMTGGCGGGGLSTTANPSRTGGGITLPNTPSYFPAHPGGASVAAATDPANPGLAGYRIDNGPGGFFYYGGTGSSSTSTTATGTGLVQAPGGNGGIGSGGGGSGGARTGSTATSNAYGGPGLVVITCY